MTSILFSSVSVYSSSRLITVDGEPDFVLVQDRMPLEAEPGVYLIDVGIKNNGSAAAVPGNMPVTWENLYYELVLDNGKGMLNETTMDHDLDGDGDKTATFNVTWFHNVTRQWDAVINGSTENKYIYSLWEGTTESPWSNQTHKINGASKLFQLGNQEHVLYGADNDTARFGFGAVIMTHPSPYLELEVNSSLRVVNMRIDSVFSFPWSPVEVNHTGTREVYSEGNWMTMTRYIISNPAFELDAGKGVTFSFFLVASEAMSAYLGLSMNWSPDGDVRRSWKLHETPVLTQALNLPFLWTLDYSYTPGETGELSFNATLINYGLPVTAGTVQTSQEDLFYDMKIPLGVGTLDESEVGIDLNGDGDQTDTFDVKWAGSTTRKWDVNITDGITEIHAYAIQEPGYLAWYIRNYTINGQSKVFQLGSENHSLYFADLYGEFNGEETVLFGLGNVVVFTHPSPCFQLIVYSTGDDSLNDLTVEDFKINGKTAELNYSKSMRDNMEKFYIVSSPGLEIATGEQATFSCTIKAASNTSFTLELWVNWSPDGIQRYMWPNFLGNFPDLNITWPSQEDTSTPTTTTATTSSSTTSGTPGFTFLAAVVLVLVKPIVFTRRRRKRD